MDAKGVWAPGGGTRGRVDELKASRERIISSSAAERLRLELELHEGTEQELVLLALKLSHLHRKLESDPELAAFVDELREGLDQALRQLRDLAHGIHPSLTSYNGPPRAIAEAVRRAAVPATLHCDGHGVYPPEVEATVYFCCREALRNASRHAGIAHVDVRLTLREEWVRFEVADNGSGFDSSRATPGTGILSMIDRLEALGGELQLESAPGAGTRVVGFVPVGR